MARRVLTRVALAALGLLLAVMVALAAGLYWLGTPHALEWLSRRAVEASDGRLALEGVSGSLYDRIRAEQVSFKDDGIAVQARNIAFEWRPRALLDRELRISELSAGFLRIVPADAKPAEPSPPPELPAALGLPLQVNVENARFDRIEFGADQAVEDLRFRYRGGAAGHELDLLNVAYQQWQADGALEMAARPPYATSGAFIVKGDIDDTPLAVNIAIGGTLKALDIEATASPRNAAIKAQALVHPFAPVPIEKVQISAEGIDLRAWRKNLPRTRLALEGQARMQAGDAWEGTIRISNSQPGKIDAERVPVKEASFAFSGAGERWSVKNLDLQLAGAGRIQGAGTIDGAKANFDLGLKNVDPAALHGRMQRLPVTGRITLRGDPDAQRLEASLTGAGAKLALAARHTGEAVVVEKGALDAEGGRLEFSGRLALTAEQPFAVDARFRNLDPSRFIDAPAARLNGTVAASGRLVPGWRAKVDVDIAQSRFRDLPLEASAQFTTSEQEWFSGNASAGLGANRVRIAGRFGQKEGQLTWSVDAPRLQQLDPAVSGSANARGTLAGSLEQPAVEFDATVKGLTAAGARAARIRANGRLDAGIDGTFRVSVDAAGIEAGGTALSTLELGLKGTRKQHEIDFRTKGPKIEAAMRAAGGLDEKWRWKGTVESLRAGGLVDVRLTAPAQVEVGPDVIVAENLRAALLGGQLGPASVRMAGGRIASRGTFAGIRAEQLLALAPDTVVESRGLTLGGTWDVEAGETISGSAAIRREGGDLRVEGETNLALGLRELVLTLSAKNNVIAARLDASGERVGDLSARVETRVDRRDGAWVLTQQAPLSGNVVFEMRSIAWASALLPRIDRLGGSTEARLDISGTAGQPQITGTASADNVSIRALDMGLRYTDGTLRARFEGTKLTVSKLFLRAGQGSIEAQGTADFSGGLKDLRIAARADNARIVSSPDLRIVLSGSGQAGFQDRRLALDGKFKINEGFYDLGTERRPELDEDVVIAGRSSGPAPAPGKDPVGVALDVTIDLNDAFTVRGRGLDALLGGSIRLVTRGDTIAALGTIRTVRGDYLAFGQLLDIQRGALSFSGPLRNPGIDLRAGRKVKSVNVGVEVTGSLQRPTVKLVSEPSMSDSDKLAWLILGRDPQTASATELALLQAMALTSNSSRTPTIQKRIAEGLGLDEFSVGRGEESVGVLSLGKRLTDRLTVRLEQGLGGTAGSLFKIDYLLSERWRLEGTTGAENAGDILFTLRFD